MMRKRITPWLAALLLLPALACGPSENPSSGPPEGAQLYEVQRCVICHKASGRGGALGPTLVDRAEYWTREKLAEYLADPASFVGTDARLNSLAIQFNMQMPPVPLTLEQRLLLADYVLGFTKPQQPQQPQ